MSPKDHVIYGTLASAALYPTLGGTTAYFWAASFLIDLDHYLDYVYHNNFTDFSLRKMFDYHKALDGFWRRPEFLNLEVFHAIEFLTLLYIVAAWTASVPLMAVFFGFVFHSVLDMLYLYKNDAFFIRTYSFTEFFIRNRRLIEMGYRPSDIYSDAVKITNGEELTLK